MTAEAVPAGEVAARTRETLALLRRMRRSHLREQAGSAAFAAYATVIGLVVYGGALLPWLRRLSTGGQPAADAGRFAAARRPPSSPWYSSRCSRSCATRCGAGRSRCRYRR